MTLLALTRVDVADYVQTLIFVYLILLIIRVLMSWIPRMPYNRWLNMFLTFVIDVTDPYLRIFRRLIPPIKIGPGALDLSPTIGIFVLWIGGALIVSLIQG